MTEWSEKTVGYAVSRDPSMQPAEAKPLCILASYIFSERLPYFLEG